MSVAHIASLAEFKTVIAASRLTVVDFFAKWCGPCKQIAPHIEKLAKEKPNVSFVKVDVDEAQEVAAEYRIRAMPTFMLFKGGSRVEMFEGADWNRLLQAVAQHETAAAAPVAPIPSDEALAAMSAKELLQLMKDHHIPAGGIPDKEDIIAEIKKYRK